MFLLFLACTNPSPHQLLQSYAQKYQFPPPEQLSEHISLLNLPKERKLSIQEYTQHSHIEITLHGGLRLSDSVSQKAATQSITKLMVWNYEMTNASFSINPQSSVILLSSWSDTKRLNIVHLEEVILNLQNEGENRFPILQAALQDRIP